jgi:hypothetical protein
MNAREMAKKSKRQKRANLQRAQQGQFFGTKRPFGLDILTEEAAKAARAAGQSICIVRPDEAEAIRDAIDLLLAGGSLREIAKRLNSASFRTPQTGGEWSGTVVSELLRNPRLVGWRTYQGEIVCGPDGQPVQAEWPALVDIAKWQAAQAILSDPNRKFKYGTSHPSPLLLSGIAFCECGAKIESGGQIKGRRRYRCSSMQGGVMREAAPVDDYIERVVLARLAQPDLIEHFRPEPEGAGADLAELRRQANEIHAWKIEISEAFGARTMNRAQFETANARADADLAAIEAKMAVDTRSVAVAALLTELDVRRGWQALSLSSKRGVIDLLMEVTLLSPKAMRVRPYVYEQGVRRVNSDTIRVMWK